MRAADELQGPVAHDQKWLLLALVALLAVAVYYAAALWFTRTRPPRAVAPEPADAWVSRLDDVGSAVGSGRMSARQGHQEISRTVREFVSKRSGVPAPTMTLADLQEHGPGRLTELVALVYPPSFSDDDVLPDASFDDAFAQARTLVTTWS